MAKMRGHIRRGRCHLPGHGHAHMKGAQNGYVCEVTAEAGKPMSRATEKRYASKEIEEESWQRSTDGCAPGS